MKDRIATSFARQSMMKTFGAKLDEVREGRVILSAPILPGSRQQQGFAHAALTFGLGDSAASYAALTTLPEDQEVVTAEIKINLTTPANGERLIAKGRVIKPGRRLIVVSSEVFTMTNGTETLVAVLQGTMVPVNL
ncbi:PaaI family thioesterase [uncultured Tateyamaria sp.]|uniref:PaaI family thioesterase n=1 Tax=uncultured Tateyamaria sp. TaxID=455651 RepID=UPI0026354D48|nr:PaaI family thioesterase [uncultured Tateyamaria sp.]